MKKVANPFHSTVIFLDPETNRSYNYTQVRSAALDFAKGLKAVWEWKKGDVLALFTPNSIDTPVVTWGTLWYAYFYTTLLPLLLKAPEVGAVVGALLLDVPALDTVSSPRSHPSKSAKTHINSIVGREE